MAAVASDLMLIREESLESMYRAVASRDRRFDGRFVFGVTSTGIYCRPSCPARTPTLANVRYFAVPAAAVAAGFRACRRCRPDRVSVQPHVPDDNGLVDRALTLIAQGVVDESGVNGLASRLSVSERHLNRLLMASVGTGAVPLAQARRAQIARTLLEQTELPVTDVAFAAGFGSLRQFNDVIKAEYGASPSELRRTPAKPDRPAQPGSLTLRLPVTGAWDAARMLRFLGARAIPGVEDFDGDRYTRSVRTPQGAAVVSVSRGDGAAHVEVITEDLSAVAHVMTTVRRLCDLSADIAAAEKVLASERALRQLVQRRPGLRVPGTVAGWEIVVRAIVGQQVSVPAARTLVGRIVDQCGASLPAALARGAVRSLFPTPEGVLGADLSGLGMTGARVRSLHSAATAAVQGHLLLDPGDDVVEARRRLLALPGVGPWTTEYIAMRALADPDAWPVTDLVLAREAARVNADELRPWRAYAALHLWTNVAEETS